MISVVSLGLAACAGGGSSTERRDASSDDAGTDAGTMPVGVDAGSRDAGSRDASASSDDAGACSLGLTRCGGSCVDTNSEPTSCGACGRTCSVPNATAACVEGECALGTCLDGFLDCDGALANGCERADACVVGAACSTSCGTTGAQACADRCAPTCTPPAEVCNLRDDDCNGQCDEGAIPGCRFAVHRGLGNGGHIFSTDFGQVTSNGYSLEHASIFHIYARAADGLSTLYRCRKSNGLTFLTTASSCEGQVLVETMGFVAPDARCGAVPLYRLQAGGNHFYTTSVAERDNAISTFGYALEGIAGHVWLAP